MRIKPILFNTDMVRAILDGRKTETRRVVRLKYSNTHLEMFINKYGTSLIEMQNEEPGVTTIKNPDGTTRHKLLACIEKVPPYRPGDILYVRETYCPNYFDFVTQYENRHGYKADYDEAILSSDITEPKWIPSIHMPKEAARIWLNVKDVRVERLQEMRFEDCLAEGAFVYLAADGRFNRDVVESEAIRKFGELWNSTVKKADISLFGWSANPWVWVIEFERCEKPKEV